MANEDPNLQAQPDKNFVAEPAPTRDTEPAPKRVVEPTTVYVDPPPKDPVNVAADAFGQYKARLAMRAEPAPSFSMPQPAMPGPGGAGSGAGFEMLANSLGTTLRLGVNLINAALWSGANALTALGRWEGEMGEQPRSWGCDDGCGPDCCEQLGCGCCRPQVRGC
jgi:hypothetical protein